MLYLSNMTSISETEQTTEMKVVNIKELHKKPDKIDHTDETEWYRKMWVWAAFGSSISIILAIMGIFEHSILFVTPAGPIMGCAAWYIWRNFKRIGSYDKDLFRK